ncbi:transposase [Bacteroidota bacterium]
MYFIRKFNPEIHHRHSVRLLRWDYSKPGFYFITINSRGQHNMLFGDIIAGDMVLNVFGTIVQDEWIRTSAIRPFVELDDFIVMPDHFHGIIRLLPHNPVGAISQIAPTGARPHGPQRGSIGAIVAQFKMQTTKRINNLTGRRGGSVWQRSFYDRIIWGLDDLARVRKYIRDNPQTSIIPE